MASQLPSLSRVLLADLPGPARRAVAALLEHLEGVVLVGETDNRDELGLALDGTRPDVLVIDDRLLGDGRVPLPTRPRVIVLGVDEDPAFAARARTLGADAWVVKDRADEDLRSLLVPA